MAESKPKKEEARAGSNDVINLRVVGQIGGVILVKMKKTAPLGKLMHAYCSHYGLAVNHLHFRYNGQPVNETDTPASLEMEDNDSIDVFQQQIGGVMGALLARAVRGDPRAPYPWPYVVT